MVAKFIFKRGDEVKEIPCAPLLTIGRVPPNDIVVHHPKVSRNHALIRMLQPGDYYVIDIGSTNGTLVNNKRIVMPTLLANGDVIAIEDGTLTFQAQEAVAEDEDGDDATMAQMTMASSMADLTSEITILVCDIRSYTSLSEKMPTKDLAQMMAKWFKMATQVIEENAGTIDKFIGDAVMVRWTINNKDVKESVVHALKVAKALNDMSIQINQLFAATLPQPFRVGVGINSGACALGSLGGGGYREFTALGDAVNMAFRFESECKNLGKDLVVGIDSCSHLPKALWEQTLIPVTVKGKTEAVSVWPLLFSDLERVIAEL
jgi:adenylate cyclase